ncbi:N-acetylmuramoyl-L-alanine amidase [Conexibacter sp. JD483]|uniref:N-acetylmuramoyl-L-alanine amidase n=1 Tax=unclassified Conexibacter TaxID=2627773 RepID=UPI00271D6771|nr:MULTISPECIES: N-acetylmuramoyl-L-alanine amidase [unclassified Conexibacter]MDO8186339.1 N-acetylmuramoyl-L-alanine amidase [Conexibacter sp. CPCC 205706]MDO8197544.1 N-acetylmuramoyl-L-alanine amidase [Conexibacter sp. CPCC 205762]MDR9369634.1 N-acetylmuramoyl-L-alanine amidase [Conexibacter sp. JD483]
MRRIVVSVIAALLVALAAAAPSFAAGPADFEQRLPAGVLAPASGAATAAAGTEARADASSALRVSAPLRAPRPFQLLGLRWRGGGEAHVEVRVRRPGRSWSRWGEIPHAEDAPPAARRARGEQSSGPLWTGRAQTYQLRAARLPRDLRLHFVFVPAAASARVAQAEPPQSGPSDSARPAIVPRSEWDPSNACPPRSAPKYGRVDLGIVHHTESLNSYSRSEAAAVVLGICRFHRNGNGWLDIGYNLLVDRFGTVYEGRAGGVEQPVIGAQAGGWNSVSTGVAVIGSYTRSRPPAAARAALAQVLAWKLSLAGIPAGGTIVKQSYGGAENRWPSGADVRLNRVAGHRDVDSTDCPGGALYAWLPQLRTEVASQLTIGADQLTNSPVGGVVAAGGPVSLTGRLTLAGGRRPVGARLTLQRRDEPDAEWTDLDTLRTGGDGIWSAAVPVTVNGGFRVVAASGVASPAVSAQVAAGVTARVAPQLLRPGRRVTVSGTTTPAKARVTVLIERQARDGGAWRRVRRLTLETVDGAWESTLPLRALGRYRVLASSAADDVNAAGTAPVRTARVAKR